MATRIANQQMFQLWFVKTITTLAVVIFVSFHIWLFGTTIYKNEFGPVVDVCYRDILSDDYTPSKLIPASSFLLISMSTSITIGFELAMYRFIKKRRQQVQPEVALVSWNGNGQEDFQPPRVSYGSKDPYAKVLVPMKATCLGLVSLLMCVIVMLIVLFGFGLENDVEFRVYFLHILAMLGFITDMPLILWLTVKSNEKKVSKGPVVKPPMELQFHE